jgi:HSP20 family protein
MNNKDIIPSEWISRFFDTGFGSGRRGRRGLFNSTDIFGDFDNIHEEMNRMFDVFNNISTNAPKELVREYETQEGNKVREVGPSDQTVNLT